MKSQLRGTAVVLCGILAPRSTAQTVFMCIEKWSRSALPLSYPMQEALSKRQLTNRAAIV